MTERPRAVLAAEAAPRVKPSVYPPEFSRRTEGRLKRPLGDLFGLSNFGVNFTVLQPGAASSLHHRHSTQDEFVYVIQGRPTLILDEEILQLEPGMCTGFRAGGSAHHLENRSDEEVVILEVGDRTEGDAIFYPNDDIAATLVDGKWIFARKDGSPFQAQ